MRQFVSTMSLSIQQSQVVLLPYIYRDQCAVNIWSDQELLAAAEAALQQGELGQVGSSHGCPCAVCGHVLSLRVNTDKAIPTASKYCSHFSASEWCLVLARLCWRWGFVYLACIPIISCSVKAMHGIPRHSAQWKNIWILSWNLTYFDLFWSYCDPMAYGDLQWPTEWNLAPDHYRQPFAAKLVFCKQIPCGIFYMLLGLGKRSCFHDKVCYDHTGGQKSMIFHMRMGRDDESF